MQIILTPQQKQRLEEMHDSTRDGPVRDRITAVLLASEGWSQTMISQALRIHESTVARQLSDYVLSEKLQPENGGSQSRLSAGQTMRLIEHLAERTYFIPSKLSLIYRLSLVSVIRCWNEQVATSSRFFI